MLVYEALQEKFLLHGQMKTVLFATARTQPSVWQLCNLFGCVIGQMNISLSSIDARL